MTVNKPESSVDHGKELLRKLVAILTPVVPAPARAPEPSSMDMLVQLLIGKFAKNKPVDVFSAFQPGKINVFIFYFIECFTTTFLRAHSWLNWVDEDDDEHDEVGLKEQPEDTRYIKNITSK